MKKIEIITKVVNGKFLRNRNLIISAVKQFEGKEITLTLQRKFKKRTEQQNDYYWSVIVELTRKGLIDNTGEFYSQKEAHDILKSKCNTREIVNLETGEIDSIMRSTTENTTVEMEEYNEKCRRWAKEYLGVDIPLPGEVLTIEF